ncbi:hypothetical protein LOD99_13877 [Oopsacas minuta]|uniref:Eyes absent homolog n=1 Tax=Oopsacas minuta TaxID=111878 RepID=A0AAV7KGM8_9METZ|nr:hypothetical protein LOD99_13877 [Oopsacas minuta]
MISTLPEKEEINNLTDLGSPGVQTGGQTYRDSSHSPEITDDVFSPNTQPQENKVSYSYNEISVSSSTSSSPSETREFSYYQGSHFSANQIARSETGESCQDFEEIMKKVEQRNSQSESVFTDGPAAPTFGAQNLEQQSLSSFTQLMSESFNTSFDLTSISENSGQFIHQKSPLYLGTQKPVTSPPLPSASFYQTPETESSSDKSSIQPPFYPAHVDPSCMYYPGYWAPYSSKDYINRLYYARRYAPYQQKSSSTSTHPYAFSKPSTPNGSTSSFSSYPTTPTIYPASLNGSSSSFDGAGMSLGAGHYGSTSSLSPVESPVSAGYVSKRKSGRRKKRSQPITASVEPHTTRVFVWDLDETSIILMSLLNGMFAGKFNHDSDTLQEIGLSMSDIIYNLINTHFFHTELEECDQVHFEDVSLEDTGIDLSSYDFSTDGFTFAEIQSQSQGHKNSTSGTPSATSSTSISCPGSVRNTQDWCKKLAYRYRRIQEIYSKYGCDLETLLGQEQYTTWYQLLCKLERITEQWVSQARKCLMLIQSTPGYINILVSSSPLILTLGKCLLFGLSQVFQVQNVYSSDNTGKCDVFERLVNRFGTKCTYVSIGDSHEDEDASKKHNFPFWRVSSQNDLIALERALQLQHL